MTAGVSALAPHFATQNASHAQVISEGKRELPKPPPILAKSLGPANT